jgi:hypothetical protein
MSPYQPGPYGAPPPHMQGPPPSHGYHQDPRGFPNRSHGSPPNPTPFQRPMSSGLPPAPGLPAKPAVVPTATQWEMQQYHQGIVNAPPGINNGASASGNGGQGSKIKDEDLDELFADVAKNGSAPAPAKQAVSEPPAAPQPPRAELPTPAHTTENTTTAPTTSTPAMTEIKPKSKAKQTKLVFSDNVTSPEEKMAQLEKYKFEMTDQEKMHDREETVLANATATVTGTVGTPPEE